MSNLRPALVLLAVFTLITGVLYPVVVGLTARVAWSGQAAGSMISVDGRRVGSALVGQAYVWSRASAVGYDAKTSMGTNQGPRNPALIEAVQGRIAALHAADPDARGAVPIDLVTASGSGLDPHVSPAAARFQIGRVARARGATIAAVTAVVERHVEGRTFGFLGEPRVNVLRLNLALDRELGTTR